MTDLQGVESNKIKIKDKRWGTRIIEIAKNEINYYYNKGSCKQSELFVCCIFLLKTISGTSRFLESQS